MSKYHLKFSIYKILVDGSSSFDLSIFSEIKSETEPQKTRGEELLSAAKVSRSDMEDRFLKVHRIEGERNPYPKIVVNQSSEEEDNPRPEDLIELTNQYFLMIDCLSGLLYLTDLRRKGFIEKWLTLKIKKSVALKSVFTDQEFIDKVKSINKISFAIEPGTLPQLLTGSSRGDSLVDVLNRDDYGYKAQKAYVAFHYSQPVDLVNKVKELISRKSAYKGMIIEGKTDQGAESILNMEEVISKIVLELDVDLSSQLDETLVFNKLVEEIKRHEG